MLVVTGIRRGLDLSDLRQGPVRQIGEVLGDRGDVVGVVGWYGLSPFKKLHIAQPQETSGIVGRPRTTAVGRVHINLPRDACGLQLLKDCRRRQQGLVLLVGSYRICISLRRSCDEIFAIRMGSGYCRVEPSIRSGKV